MYNINMDCKNLFVDSELLNYDELKSAIEKTLNTINDARLIKFIRVLPTVKPTIKFRTLYYLLEEFKGNNDLTHEFDVMRRFIGCDFDIFMFVNHLRKQKKIATIKE